MAGPGLSTTRSAGVTGHISDSNTVHGIVNGFDTALKTATSGHVLTWNGSVYAPAAPTAAASSPWMANVKDYGATGDGSTDDSTAILAARNAVFNSRTGAYPSKPILFFPPGNYKIVSPDTLFPGSTSTAMCGYQIIGAGREVTSILFRPVGGSSTLTNMNLMTASGAASIGAVLEGFRMEGINVDCNNSFASFAYFNSVTGSYVQDTQIKDVSFTGAWKRVFGLDGGATANLNSEMLFESVSTASSTTTFADAFLHSGLTTPGSNPQQDQFLNYWIKNCKMEHFSGDTFVFDKGGSIVVDGGSFILGGAAGGTHFKMGDYSHYDSVMHLVATGVRFELRNTNSRVIDCAWRGSGHVSFNGCSDAAYGYLYQINGTGGGTANYDTHVYRTPSDVGPIVRYQDCELMGYHRVVTTATPPTQMKIIYDGCNFKNMQGGGSATIAAGVGEMLRWDGGAVKRRFQDCMFTTDSNT